ncbi:hypothetical protein EBU94_01910 [bacterium]|nr:hypothetical protein [bacterium]
MSLNQICSQNGTNSFKPEVAFETMSLTTLNGSNVNDIIADAQKINSVNATAPIFWNPNTLNISYYNPAPKANIPDGVNYSDYLFWNNTTGDWNIGDNNVHLGSGSSELNNGNYTVALGFQAGNDSQVDNAVAVGRETGKLNQQARAVAVGFSSGQQDQGEDSVAIGNQAGSLQQGFASVALGTQSGFINQGNYCLAIGTYSGYQNQGEGALAIGTNAGGENQGGYSTSINASAGQFNQGQYGVAIGFAAGQNNQGQASIAIGQFAAQNNQPANSIVLNASGALQDATNSGLYINPVRNDNDATFNAITYDTVNKELVYNSTKTFVIQHPEHDNKYLVHACLEGPEAGVYYRGKGDTYNRLKTCIVSLPSYVKHICKVEDITVVCSVEDNIECSEFFPVLKCSKVDREGRFTVKSNIACNFNWICIGKRQSIETEVYKDKVNLQGSGPYKYIE